MLDRLPHDLILYLADLLVPVPTSRNLEERQETCKALSLVHRTWTAVAQKKLGEHVLAVVPAPPGRVEQRFAHAAARGGQVRTVEVRGPDDGGPTYDVDNVLRRCGTAAQLVLKGPLAEPSWNLVPKLTTLSVNRHINDLFTAEPCGAFAASILPSTLTHLSLSYIVLTSSPPPLPHCDTLLLTHTLLPWDDFVPSTTTPLPAGSLMESFPSLRVFGARQCPATLLESLVQDLPPTVEHLLTDLLPWPLVQNEPLVKSRASNGRATLRSVTVLTSQAITEKDVTKWFDQLRVWCPLPGTQLKTLEEEADWDLEAWSWSVV
ncbi:hypothetical protein JCM6882_004905 [Rhodosporidiobolus microsporus]